MANNKKQKKKTTPKLPPFKYGDGGGLGSDLFSAGATLASSAIDTFGDQGMSDRTTDRDIAKNTLSGGISAAGQGAKLGSAFGPLGTGVGAAAGFIGGSILSNIKGNQLQDDQFNALKSKFYGANGGSLDPFMLAMGGDIEEINGPRHEQGGVQMGANAEVEGGEVKVDDYIFSDRLGLPDSKTTFADEAKKIKKKYELRDDAITLRSQKAELTKLMEANEQIRIAKEAEDKEKQAAIAEKEAVANLGQEEMPQGQGQVPVEQPPMDPMSQEGATAQEFANGGPITDSTQVEVPDLDFSKDKLDIPVNLEGFNRDITKLPIPRLQTERGELNLPSQFANGGPLDEQFLSDFSKNTDYRNDPNLSDKVKRKLDEIHRDTLYTLAETERAIPRSNQQYTPSELIKARATAQGRPKQFWPGGPLDELNNGLKPFLELPQAGLSQGSDIPVGVIPDFGQQFGVTPLPSSIDPFDAPSRAGSALNSPAGLDRNTGLPVEFQDNPLKMNGTTKDKIKEGLNKLTNKGEETTSGNNEEKAFIASSLPALDNMIRGMKPEVTKFDRVKAANIDLDPQRQAMARQASLARNIQRENVRGSAKSSGEALTAMSTGNAAITGNLNEQLGQSYMAQENANAQIRNAANAQNTQISNQEIIANEQNRAMAATLKNMGLSDISTNYQGYIKDKKMGSENARQNDRLMSVINATFPNYRWEDDNGEFALQFEQQYKTTQNNAYGGYILPKM